MSRQHLSRVFLAIAVIIGWSSDWTIHAQVKTVNKVSFCQLISRPEAYLDRAVTIRARVRIYRHGTSITDSACPNRSLLLVSNPKKSETESASKFYQFLSQHRQSRKAIFAEIVGHLVRGQESSFVLKRDFDFQLQSVTEFSVENQQK